MSNLAKYHPPFEHLAETGYLITATIVHNDEIGPSSVLTSTVVENAAAVPQAVADALFSVEVLSDENKKVVAMAMSVLNNPDEWLVNRLTGCPCRADVFFVDGEEKQFEILLQVYTLVAAVRRENVE